MKKTVRNENAPVRLLYDHLRKQASRIAGVSVYRPACPDALFFSYLRPENDSRSQEILSGENDLFDIRRGMKGNTPILLWDVRPGTFMNLINDERVLPDDPEGNREVLENPCESDTGLILRTCEGLMKDKTLFEGPDELLRLTLYRLAFSEEDLLAAELPGRIAVLQRRHRSLSPAAAKLIRLYLDGKNRARTSVSV